MKFTFVTHGVESVIQQAKEAAGEREMTIAGNTDIVSQVLQVGQVDGIHIEIVPVLLGNGLLPFKTVGDQPVQLEKIQVIELPVCTHIRFRVL